MKRLIVFASLAVLCIAGTTVPASAEYRYRYEGTFSSDERIKLETWIGEVRAGLESLVGPFDFHVDIYFVRVDSGQPVVFSNTIRGRRQGIRLRVDPDFPLEDFLADWTAPHEFSHLALPYLGQEHSWFAEGFASFMQYQVMHAMGTLSAERIAARLAERINAAALAYRYDDVAFVTAAPRLRRERNYPTMYWGGAVFFLRLNESLEESAATDIVSLIADYVQCCRRGRDALDNLVDELDRIVGEPLVSDELSNFVSTAGFPAYEDLDLGVVSPGAD